MINILQIGMGPNPGGMENCIMNYYRKIDCTKYQFDFIDMYGKGLAYAKEIGNKGGKIYSLSYYKKYPLRMKKELEEILSNNQYDIVHINMLSAANVLPAHVACRNGSAKVIVHSHNSAIPSGFMRRLLNNINIHILRKLPVEKWACGYKAGTWMWGNEFKRENIIPNAIDDRLFLQDVDIRNRIREKCRFCESDRIIGFVGRLEEQKNPLFLLDILAELRKLGLSYKLLVVGDGYMREAFMRKVEQLDLKEYVFWAGVQYDTNNWYQAMDAFVLPSFFEGLPVVGIEAQASGLPCFVSNTITDELNVCGTLQYLPINQGAEIWATQIFNTLEMKAKNKVELPPKYKIQSAVKKLEQMYDKLVV